MGLEDIKTSPVEACLLISIKGYFETSSGILLPAYLCTNVAFHRVSAITVVGSSHKSPIIVINISQESQIDSERHIIAIINE